MTEETTIPEVAEVENDETQEVAEESTDELLEDEGAEVEETEEVEHDGRKYSIPKPLKAALMMHGDYTRKTQEVAEQRRALEEGQRAFVQETEAHRQDLMEVARVVAIDDQLRQFDQVDLLALNQTDPVRAQELFFQRQRLIEARQAVAATLQQRQQQRTFEKQQKSAKQIEEGRAAIAKEIKDWSPELADKLRNFAANEGWSAEEINAVTPAQVKSLHRAFLASQVLNKSPKATTAAPIKPASTVKPKGAAVLTYRPDMSDADYAKWRKSQIRNRK